MSVSQPRLYLPRFPIRALFKTMRRNWHRDSLVMSIAAIALITLFLGGLLTLIHSREVTAERHSLIKSMLWAEQHLHLQLTAVEERLQQLSFQSGFDREVTATSIIQAHHLVANRPEVERVIWLDSNAQVKLAVPPVEGSLTPSEETFLLARALGNRRYSGPVKSPAGDSRLEIHQPIFHGDRFDGMLVAVISLPALLKESLPWWFAERYHAELIDGQGNILTARSQVPALGGGTSHTITLDPPGNGMALIATVYHTETTLARNLLIVAIAAVVLTAIFSLWSARRQISRRLQAEQALRAEHAFRKAMEDSLMVGMRARDMNGRITYVNPAFCRMVGWTEEELVGCAPPMPYWAPEEMERTLQLHAAILSGKAPAGGFEIRFQRRDGTHFEALVYEAPLIGADGRQAGWMGSVLDISDRRQAEEMARLHREKLQHTARLVVMGEMASAIAHELNQPLSAIASYATGLVNRLEEGDRNTAQHLAVLEKLNRQAQRAGETIRRVYNFVRKSEPKLGPCNIAAVLEDWAELFQPEAKKRGVRLERNWPATLPEVEADSVLIGQTIANLARNGMDAMTATDRDKRVLRISAYAEKAAIVVSVSDRGCGIDPAATEHIFEPFYTTKEEGMGMGLNICRSIIESHRGRLWVQQNPEGGSTFLFTLPTIRP
ncbi:ATP-binding protein [Telmatospirillum sp. J64-1]|uniref:sensor histidine kinase n=1 Tax=Telmatospirillum sp. J64-1 TaxID=2502183 RepID=UPI0021073CA1|nr:ATP-binding protein [Telmatospirillum sp. J64-1]